MRKAAMSAIHALAKRDPRVVFVGSDLGAGTLADMRDEMPERFFMEGISEGAIVGMAAGLALDGYIPYVHTIATFLTRRCYDQVAIDVCLQHLAVRFIGGGGGAVYAPLGPTHMATDDLAIMRALPGMTIVAPSDAPEMTRAMHGSLEVPGPVYVRIAKGGETVSSRADLPFEIGRAILLRAGADLLFIATGIMSTAALRAAELLESDGIAAGVLHMHTVKPLDEEAVELYAGRVQLIVSVEEHSRIGGLGSALAETLVDADLRTPLMRLALPDRFMRDYGSQEYVLRQAGLLPEQIAAAVRARLGRRNLNAVLRTV
jgi:transketolase